MDQLLSKSKLYAEQIAGLDKDKDDSIIEARKEEIIKVFTDKFGQPTADDKLFFGGDVSLVSTRVLEIYDFLCLDHPALIDALVDWMLGNYETVVERRIDRYLDICMEIEETSCAFRRTGRCVDRTDAAINRHTHCKRQYPKGEPSLEKYIDLICEDIERAAFLAPVVTGGPDGLVTEGESSYLVSSKPTREMVENVFHEASSILAIARRSLVFHRDATKYMYGNDLFMFRNNCVSVPTFYLDIVVTCTGERKYFIKLAANRHRVPSECICGPELSVPEGGGPYWETLYVSPTAISAYNFAGAIEVTFSVDGDDILRPMEVIM